MFLQLKIFLSVLLVANFVNSCNGGVVQPTNQLSRMAWGEDSSIEKHPHLVGISSSLGNCTASLISSTCVLTAAHCVKNGKTKQDIPAEDITIRGGTTIFGEGGYVQYVEKLRTPNNYDEIHGDMDIAVIKLKQPLSGENIKPIQIDFDDESTSEGDSLTVAGWGDTQFRDTQNTQLKETHVTQSSCRIYKPIFDLFNLISNKTGEKFGLTENMLCAWNWLRNPCPGDSGAPYVHNGKQVGIVSFGLDFGLCGLTPLPAIYTNLKSHEVKEFFDKATQELNCWD